MGVASAKAAAATRALKERFPGERESLERLAHFLEALENPPPHSIGELYRAASPRSQRAFVRILHHLCESGALREQFQVASGDGPRYFDRLESTPYSLAAEVMDPDGVRLVYAPDAGSGAHEHP